jgi:hypothetical protein
MLDLKDSLVSRLGLLGTIDIDESIFKVSSFK